MQEKNKINIRSYIAPLVALLIAVGVCLYFFNNPFEATGAKDVVMCFCNAFTVPGVIFFGFAVLTYLSSLGAYDGLGYTFYNFGLHNLWPTKHPKKYKNLYEYKENKDKKGRAWWKSGLVVGLFSLLISAILLIVYLIL
jgi:hypothetical protein